MKQPSINRSYFIAGILFIITSILLYVFNVDFIIFVTKAIALILLIFGAWHLIELAIDGVNHRQKRKPMIHASVALGQIIVGLILLWWHDYSPLVIVSISGIYQLLMGLIGLFSFYLLVKDQAKSRWSQLVNTMIHLGFAFSSLFATDKIEDTILRLSLYLFFLGMNYLYDAQLEVDRHLLNYQHRRIRMPLPLMISALMPYQILLKLNEYMKQGKNPMESSKFSYSKTTDVNENQIDIEVFVHTGRTGFDRIGHTDIAYKGIVYSYGNHDAEERYLYDAIGPGVVMVCPRDEYVDFLMSRKVTMFSFGMHLTRQEEIDFENNMADLFENLVPFEITTNKQRESFIGILVNSTSANLYKFKQGQFKTYFVFGTNCVLFADYLLWKSGIDILAFASIMTPGTYFDYFNREYLKAKSKVVSRKVLNQNLREFQERSEMNGTSV